MKAKVLEAKHIVNSINHKEDNVLEIVVFMKVEEHLIIDIIIFTVELQNISSVIDNVHEDRNIYTSITENEIIKDEEETMINEDQINHVLDDRILNYNHIETEVESLKLNQDVIVTVKEHVILNDIFKKEDRKV